MRTKHNMDAQEKFMPAFLQFVSHVPRAGTPAVCVQGRLTKSAATGSPGAVQGVGGGHLMKPELAELVRSYHKDGKSA